MLGWCFILALAKIGQARISGAIGCKGKSFGLRVGEREEVERRAESSA